MLFYEILCFFQPVQAHLRMILASRLAAGTSPRRTYGCCAVGPVESGPQPWDAAVRRLPH